MISKDRPLRRIVIDNMLDELSIDKENALIFVLDELIKVKRKYPKPFNSYAEGYGVLKREMFEVDIAFAQEKKPYRIIDEIKQVSQICIRIIGELGEKDNTVKSSLKYLKSIWRE